MLRRTARFPIPMLLLLAACGGNGTENTPTEAPKDLVDPAVMVHRIRAQEDSLFAKQEFDRRGAQALMDVYKTYQTTFPNDTMAPEYLFRAAGLSKALGDPRASVELYDRIIKTYPQWRRIASTYYMKAFTIDDGLNEKGRAKQVYEEVIMRFPDHPFAKDARAMIDNLQYTDEELIERFKKMNADSATARK